MREWHGEKLKIKTKTLYKNKRNSILYPVKLDIKKLFLGVRENS